MKLSKVRWLTVIGWTVCVVPPLAAILLCFPVWIDSGGGKTLSGVALLLSILTLLPFIKQVRNYLRSPSVFVIWIVICFVLTVLRSIINEVLLVSYIALISNSIGALIFGIRKKELSESKRKNREE